MLVPTLVQGATFELLARRLGLSRDGVRDRRGASIRVFCQHLMAMSQQVCSDRGVVSAGHPHAARAALGALERGGNAVDAVVAGAFASYVAEPNNAGIGGYGHLSLFLPADGGFLCVDHSPRAPARRRGRHVRRARRRPRRPRLAGRRPGTPTASARSRPPCRARSPGCGRPTSGPDAWSGPRSYSRRSMSPGRDSRSPGGCCWRSPTPCPTSRPTPAWRRCCCRPGACRARGPPTAPASGWLSASWRRRSSGSPLTAPTALYRGAVAEAIVATLAAAGGILTAEDLAGYAPKVFGETPARYRDLEYITAADSVGYETLGILEHFALRGRGDVADHYHLLAEAMGHAFADGAAYSSDPDHSEQPVQELGGAAFAAARAAGISEQRAAARPVAPRAPWPGPAAGARPAACTARRRSSPPTARATWRRSSPRSDRTSGRASPSRGPGSCSTTRWSTTTRGPGARTRSPRARCRSSPCRRSSPLATAGPRFAAAGSGGYPILAGVINTSVDVVDHGLPVQEAIDRPRVHSQGHHTYIDGPRRSGGPRAAAPSSVTSSSCRTSPPGSCRSAASAPSAADGGGWTAGHGSGVEHRGGRRCEPHGRRAGHDRRPGVDRAGRRHPAVRADLAAGRPPLRSRCRRSSSTCRIARTTCTRCEDALMHPWYAVARLRRPSASTSAAAATPTACSPMSTPPRSTPMRSR